MSFHFRPRDLAYMKAMDLKFAVSQIAMLAEVPVLQPDQPCDSGPGFPPARAANPFLPLFSTKEEGLGIGLSLIEAHGGIWLDADAPGAAVHFTLPIAQTPTFPVVLP
jgi:nitrogen-specific signal transduction histidine kinase